MKENPRAGGNQNLGEGAGRKQIAIDKNKGGESDSGMVSKKPPSERHKNSRSWVVLKTILGKSERRMETKGVTVSFITCKGKKEVNCAGGQGERRTLGGTKGRERVVRRLSGNLLYRQTRSGQNWG